MSVCKNHLLVRKSSFHSLVEIPTYISCRIHLTGIIPDYENCQPDIVGSPSVERLSTDQSILSEETHENMQLIERRVMCVATVFFVCCLILVGTMFVGTSKYQDMVVATMMNVSNHQVNTMYNKTIQKE